MGWLLGLPVASAGLCAVVCAAAGLLAALGWKKSRRHTPSVEDAAPTENRA